ncbi:MAG: hypothetical protein QOF41_3160 [Methylobacteriaceae bacterium]|nr:hypothetical protein [Methylobacteriaceae bacterium]
MKSCETCFSKRHLLRYNIFFRRSGLNDFYPTFEQWWRTVLVKCELLI